MSDIQAGVPLASEDVDTDLLRQLNNDIWHPFRFAYAKLDAPAFLDLHAPVLIRAGGPAKQVSGFADYSDQMEKWFAELADRGSSVTISFRFVERIAADDLASERGIFQIVSKRADGDQRAFYGRFHTYARCTDGRWRICVDYDTDERSGTLEEEFLAAIDVDDDAAFSV
ncbi:nuclear transport factor 2 family protein [Lentzea sp. PSKA42]|uniref:Nuclear transport factor 2 family protein n=1 Tax=Lentzea indica TaxID=2604800 RepID=A0ABX1FS14_9PSEU|nr:nuclear transport factor 2 family protein [Lentzea indica]